MKRKFFLTLCLLFLIVALVLSPQKYILVTSSAIEVWAKILLPALLPFFIFTKLLIGFGCIKDISQIFGKGIYKVYKTPPISAFVFFISILSGYPVGSKVACDLYQSGNIGKLDANKIITFTSNSGPMFIIGSVGIGMLSNKTFAYILYFSHILGALLNGLIYRNKRGENTFLRAKIYQSESQTLSSLVNSSIVSIMLVGGIIVVAFIVIEFLTSLNIFYPITFISSKLGISESVSNALMCGTFEITKGCLLASELLCSNIAKLCVLSAIISFGGLSTIIQSMAFLQGIVSYKFFILQKITHSILSTIVCVILCFIFI